MKKNCTKESSAKKLAAYSALAGAFIFTGNAANGQVNLIEYTDTNPDESYDGIDNVYELDLNNDGTTDFTLSILTSTSVFLSYSTGYVLSMPGNVLFGIPSDDNAIAGYAGLGSLYVYPFALDEGEDIDNDLSWYGNSFEVQSLIYSGIAETSAGATFQVFAQGSWIDGATEKFLGLRLDVDGDTHYGWLRMSTDDDNQGFTVIDYAYHTAADESLETGQTEDLFTELNTIDVSKINAYSFGNTIHIAANNLQVKSAASVQVTNTLGQSIYSNTLDQNGMSIVLDHASTGIYTVCIVADGSVYNKKVFIN